MRALATIRKIDKLSAIPNKDKIVLANIDGWQAIVQKDLFNEGDKVIFCEPDSVLPAKPEFDFLEKYGYRIKTIKMAGVISQGVAFPIKQFFSDDLDLGTDVTSRMGITQYEPTRDKDPAPVVRKRGLVKFLMQFEWFRALNRRYNLEHKDFPKFIKKTDEERIQNCPQLLESDKLWIGTEKLDGCSTTYFLRKKKFLCIPYYEFGVCSRNIRLGRPDGSVYWRMAEKYDIRNKLRRLISSEWIVIQGECIGRGIQKNVYHMPDNQFRVYSIITPKGRLNSADSYDICSKNQLQHVPLVTDTKGISLKGKTVQDMLNIATGETVLCSEPTLREGIVYRALDGETSFKAVSPAYLLRHDE